MARKEITIILVGLFGLFACSTGQGKNDNMVSTSGRFKVGEVWQYDNRAGEESSTLTILKIEKYEKGDTIIHIRIDDVRLFDRASSLRITKSIDHLPYSEKTLAKDVRKLIGQKDELPDFSAGYQEWRLSWDSGKGGYWTADLKDAINGIDSVMGGKPQ